MYFRRKMGGVFGLHNHGEWSQHRSKKNCSHGGVVDTMDGERIKGFPWIDEIPWIPRGSLEFLGDIAPERSLGNSLKGLQGTTSIVFGELS